MPGSIISAGYWPKLKCSQARHKKRKTEEPKPSPARPFETDFDLFSGSCELRFLCIWADGLHRCKRRQRLGSAWHPAAWRMHSSAEPDADAQESAVFVCCFEKRADGTLCTSSEFNAMLGSTIHPGRSFDWIFPDSYSSQSYYN